MVADLHLHTTYSDWTLDPDELVAAMSEAGFNTIAITDHDNIDGIGEAMEAGAKLGLEVIPGVEFSAEYQHNEVHILGYFIDHKAQWFIDWLKDRQKKRLQRIEKIVSRLDECGIKVDVSKVFEAAIGGSAGRPHVAQILEQEGLVSSIKEAFDRFLRHGAPAYVPHFRLTPLEVAKIIHKSGGLAVIAHPGVANIDHLIPDFAVDGIDGLEVFYSAHNEAQVEKYKRLARKFGLLMTGGSDYHGTSGMKKAEIGSVKLGDDYVNRLKKAAKDKV
ncbi:MAG: PHP domain-containing protein [bacterium]